MNKHIKNSFGGVYVNIPKINNLIDDISESQYEIDYNRKFYLFDVIPVGAVRMTQSDKWKTNPFHIDPKKQQRKSVTKYFEFKNKIQAQSLEMNYQLQNILDIVFLVPMPFTWSEKKKVKNNKKPCKVRPDIDNYVKAFMDAFAIDDAFVWKIIAEKRYSFKGSVLVYENYNK